MDNEEYPYHRQAIGHPRSKVTTSHGSSDRCWPISQDRKVPEISKLVGRLPTLWAILRTCFRVKKSKVKVSRETESVLYLRSGKAYKLQNCYADGASTATASYIKAIWRLRVLARGQPYNLFWWRLPYIVSSDHVCLHVKIYSYLLTYITYCMVGGYTVTH